MDPTFHKNAPERWFGRSIELLAPTERHVLEHAQTRSPIAEDANLAFDGKRTLGDRTADAIARIGGSWSFIIGFFVFLLIWVVANTILLTRLAFDPYPFIFLNLVLSMLAAIQAPIIMMSQNRAAERDRLVAGQDYAVNLKAEIEILSLHEKLDELRINKIEHTIALLDAMSERLARIEGHLGIAGARAPDDTGVSRSKPTIAPDALANYKGTPK